MRTATPDEVRHLCRMAGLPDQSGELRGRTLAEVKGILFELMVLMMQVREERR